MCQKTERENSAGRHLHSVWHFFSLSIRFLFPFTYRLTRLSRRTEIRNRFSGNNRVTPWGDDMLWAERWWINCCFSWALSQPITESPNNNYYFIFASLWYWDAFGWWEDVERSESKILIVGDQWKLLQRASFDWLQEVFSNRLVAISSFFWFVMLFPLVTVMSKGKTKQEERKENTNKSSWNTITNYQSRFSRLRLVTTYVFLDFLRLALQKHS